jgi:hypothetical protein
MLMSDKDENAIVIPADRQPGVSEEEEKEMAQMKARQRPKSRSEVLELAEETVRRWDAETIKRLTEKLKNK